jgi:hypothetical protein
MTRWSTPFRRPEQHSRARRLRRIVPALAAIVLVLAGWASARATFSVEFDDEAADRVIGAFESRTLSPETQRRILDVPGYRLLFEQVAAGAGSSVTPDLVAEDFRRALAASLDGDRAPGFELGRIRASPERYRAAFAEYRRLAGRLQWRVSDRLNPLLPATGRVSSTVHLIVGGSAAGFAFSDRDAVVIRLDDFVRLAGSEPLDVDRVASVLAHELFHVGFRAAGGLPPRPAEPSVGWNALAAEYGPDLVAEVWRASPIREWDADAIGTRLSAWVPPREWNTLAVDRFVTLLSKLQNEGCAVFVDAPLRDLSGSGRHAAALDAWMGTIEDDMRFLASVTARLAQLASREEIQSRMDEGFRDNGPLYRVGYQMAKRIDEHAGRRPLLESMSAGPLEFFETYFETRPYGADQIDTETESEIRRLIEAIRALGHFDPRG